jgi:hypothetical protein
MLDRPTIQVAGSAMRGGGQQRLGVWDCGWCRTTVIRRWLLLLKWKGAQASETDPNADIDNDVRSSSAMR